MSVAFGGTLFFIEFRCFKTSVGGSYLSTAGNLDLKRPEKC